MKLLRYALLFGAMYFAARFVIGLGRDVAGLILPHPVYVLGHLSILCVLGVLAFRLLDGPRD